MSLEEETEQILKDESATAEAVKSLITVKAREKGKDSDIELKTDLDDDMVNVHSVLAVINKFIENKDKINEVCILGELIEAKERKSLSKNRQSRHEIVEISRQPDIPMDMQGQVRKEGWVRRLFTPRHPVQR